MSTLDCTFVIWTWEHVAHKFKVDKVISLLLSNVEGQNFRAFLSYNVSNLTLTLNIEINDPK